MADNSAIEWTEATWNPIRARHRQTGKVGWFCVHLSDGCRNCYAEGFNARLGNGVPFKAQHQKDVELFLDEDMLLQPLRWKRPRQIFVGSMTDLFADFVPDEWIDRIFAVMALAGHHTYQVLTKRPGRMQAYFAGIEEMNEPAARWGLIEGSAQAIHAARTGEDPSLWLAVHGPLRHVWLGASVENQAAADDRRDAMAAMAAAGWTTFVSYEPAIGPVNWAGWEFIRWLIAGGESGSRARPSNPFWFRAARDFCARHRIAFFFKQWGAWWCMESHPIGTFSKVLAKARIKPTRSTPERGCWDAQGRWVPGSVAGAPPAYTMWRVGKTAAGRELDGVTHDAMPRAA